MTDCQHCHKPMRPVLVNMLCQNCRETYWRLIRQLGHVQLPALRSIMPVSYTHLTLPTTERV